MKKSNRLKMIRKYGFLYKRSEDDLEKCVYCGDKRQVLDHCPPISCLDSIDVVESKKNGMEFILYPSCSMCNGYLRDYNEIHMIDRLLFLSTKYEKKLDKMEIWSDSELVELGYNLRNLILSKQSNFDMMNNKYVKIIEKLYDIEYKNGYTN